MTPGAPMHTATLAQPDRTSHNPARTRLGIRPSAAPDVHWPRNAGEALAADLRRVADDLDAGRITIPEGVDAPLLVLGVLAARLSEARHDEIVSHLFDQLGR